MHDLDTNETYVEKSRWELHKNAMCCLEQNAICITTYIPSLKKFLVRWPRHVGHFWRNKNKMISDIVLWTTIHGHASVDRPAKTYFNYVWTLNLI